VEYYFVCCLQVVQLVFEYIRVLRNTNIDKFEALWEELRHCSKMDFLYCGSGSALSNTHFASRKLMQTNKSSKNIFTDEILFEGSYNHKPLQDVLNAINPDTTLYIHLLPKKLPQNSATMPYYCFKFTREKIPKEFLSSINDATLKFPQKNSFIGKRYQIHWNVVRQPIGKTLT